MLSSISSRSSIRRAVFLISHWALHFCKIWGGSYARRLCSHEKNPEILPLPRVGPRQYHTYIYSNKDGISSFIWYVIYSSRFTDQYLSIGNAWAWFHCGMLFQKNTLWIYLSMSYGAVSEGCPFICFFLAFSLSMSSFHFVSSPMSSNHQDTCGMGRVSYPYK